MTDTHIVRRTLFESEVLRVGHVVARPCDSYRSEIECQSSNVVVLPLAGVFAKHEGPRRQVVATPNHAVLLTAGSPYRISYPADIGDQCLTLWFSNAALARVLPQAMSRDSFDARVFASHGLLSPSAMLGRSLLRRRLARGDWDPVEVEELGIGLLVSTLHALGKERRGSGHRALRSNSGRRLRVVERVKEIICLRPEHRWTLGALAEQANVSPYHLAHLFRVEVGVSVYRYLLRTRLAKALDIVLETNSDLSAVALETGFASHSHFTARFRALFGMTPTELRRGAGTKALAKLRKIVTADRLAPV